MWGPAPILSIEKFKYYAHLVDDFFKYTWIIPLQHMFDFSNAYLAFENYISRQFNKHIKVFHKSRIHKLQTIIMLLSTGMAHQVSCSYTPEQTGIVKRRHNII